MKVEIKGTNLSDVSSELSLYFLILLRSALTAPETEDLYLLGLMSPFPFPIFLLWPHLLGSFLLIFSSREN